jgi:hypothetical protein
LNSHLSVDAFTGRYPLDKSTARFLIREDESLKSLVESRAPDLDLCYFPDRIEPLGESYYKETPEYLILDSKTVIQPIGYGEAEVIRDPDKVRKYIDHFNSLWEESQVVVPMLTLTSVTATTLTVTPTQAPIRCV